MAVLHVVVAVLAAVAVLVTLASAVGVWAMHDAFQRLHFLAPAATVGAALLALAIGLDAGPRAAVKPILVLLLLTALNGVVSHATARAAFVHRHGAWPPRPPQGAAEEVR
ncbi:MAG: monovalent cation/H(+) antiporter subunit G [Anaeromyxobacteraceae bacterium]